MPVIVIGADTEWGVAAAEALTKRPGEVRAFVSDPDTAQRLRDLGIKVAVGDLSDASHIEGAARQAFSAVVVAAAGRDERQRAFADSYEAVVETWAAGLAGAGVSRIIWVGSERRPPAPISAMSAESVAIDTTGRDPGRVAAEVVRLDDLEYLEGG